MKLARTEAEYLENSSNKYLKNYWVMAFNFSLNQTQNSLHIWSIHCHMKFNKLKSYFTSLDNYLVKPYLTVYQLLYHLTNKFCML
jgi:hypothetical protein